METEKMIRSIVRVADERTKPPQKSFRFTLLKLLTGDNPDTQKKIQSAITNSTKWETNSIQNLALNALQNLFFNAIDAIKEQRDPKLYGRDDYIKQRYIETFIGGYLDRIKDLEEEIDKLRDSSITEEEHREEIKEFKKIIKEKDNEIQRLENKLISERKFAKEKEEYNEERLRKQIEYEMKVKQASAD